MAKAIMVNSFVECFVAAKAVVYMGITIHQLLVQFMQAVINFIC